MNHLRLTTWLAAVALWCAAASPKVRPTEWAQPVIKTSIGNCFRVSDELFRAEQPDKKDIPDLKTLGIHTLVSLRHYHNDADAFTQNGLHLLHHNMDAGSASVRDLVTVLREIRTAPKPVLIHCWHGSDRTGFIVAGYRMVFQKWTAEAAIEELRHGGYGYHEATYPKIMKTLQELDVATVRKEVLE